MPAHLVRDAARVLATLKELPSGQLVALKACKIQIPTRYTSRGLAMVGADTYTYGIYALIVEDQYYTVSNINAMVKVTPARVLNVVIQGTDYTELHFDAGQIVIDNLNVVKRDALIYNIYDEFFTKGNIPWFMNYEDVGGVFDTAKEFANSSVGQTPEVIELLASIVARNPKDRRQYYRTYLSDDGVGDLPPEFIPLMSVFYAATNTLNKLAGSYFGDGVVSALVTKSNEVEHVESLLRQ